MPRKQKYRFFNDEKDGDWPTGIRRITTGNYEFVGLIANRQEGDKPVEKSIFVDGKWSPLRFFKVNWLWLTPIKYRKKK